MIELDTTKKNSRAAMTNHIMIDIETLDTEPSAHILSIAAVRFHIKTGKVIDQQEYYLSDNQPCRKFSKDTVQWWAKPEHKDAFMHIMSQPKVPLMYALMQLSEFVKPEDYVWANSPSFDLTILHHAFAQTGVHDPINFRQQMDVRTLINLFPEVIGDVEPVGTQHNALDDCLWQIRCVCVALEMTDVHHNYLDNR